MLRAAAAATAVLVGLLAGCGGGGTADVVGEASTGRVGQTQGSGTGDLLVTGRVLDDGRPLRGAEVNLLVYPARPDPTATDPTPAVEVEPVTTGESGRYAVRLPGEEVPGEYLVPLPDGSPRVEFAVVVDDGDRVSSWSEVAALVAAGGSSTGRVWRTPGAVGDDSVLTLDLDLGAQTITITDSQGRRVREGLPSR